MTGSLIPWDEIAVKQRKLHEKLSRLHPPTSADLDWVSETLTRLEAKQKTIGLNDRDCAELEKAKHILAWMRDFSDHYDPNQPRDDHGRWVRVEDYLRSVGLLPKTAEKSVSGNRTFDVSKAVDYLESHAADSFSDPMYKQNPGRCASVVTASIERGGIPIDRPISAEAKDYGDALVKSGFDEVARSPKIGAYPPPGYTLEKGDVAVIQGTTSNRKGHMAMWSGTQWISDAKQADEFFPNQSYRDIKPRYVIYRHRKRI